MRPRRALSARAHIPRLRKVLTMVEISWSSSCPMICAAMWSTRATARLTAKLMLPLTTAAMVMKTTVAAMTEYT